MLRNVLVPIHRAGWPFIGAAVLAGLGLSILWPPLLWLGLLAAAFCAFFFRDPPRLTPVRAGLVVSPADGLVAAVGAAPPPPELDMGDAPRPRVSIFLSIFDVHVNRIPVDGRVDGLAYRKGAFHNAALELASDGNERQSIRLGLADGRDIACVQIAGLVARRIVCDLALGQSVRTGERFGLIRFGSRTDIYLPQDAATLVAPGQRMVGGETVIADLASTEEPRPAEER